MLHSGDQWLSWWYQTTYRYLALRPQHSYDAMFLSNAAEPWLVHCKLFKKITSLAAWLFAYCANFKNRITLKSPAWSVLKVPKISSGLSNLFVLKYLYNILQQVFLQKLETFGRVCLKKIKKKILTSHKHHPNNQ